MKVLASFTVPYSTAVRFDELAPPRQKSRIVESLLIELMNEKEPRNFDKFWKGGYICQQTFSIDFEVMTRFRKGAYNQSAIVGYLIKEWVEKNETS